jgi:hypothetical protein
MLDVSALTPYSPQIVIEREPFRGAVASNRNVAHLWRGP